MGLHVDGSGFEDFQKLVDKYLKKVENGSVVNILKKGADGLVNDVRMLPSPRTATGHPTHMLDSVAAQIDGEKVQVGWGRYYGKFVEFGTGKMSPRKHLRPTWESNQAKYIRSMMDEFTR